MWREREIDQNFQQNNKKNNKWIKNNNNNRINEKLKIINIYKRLENFFFLIFAMKYITTFLHYTLHPQYYNFMFLNFIVER